jgi:hypothetical protein
MPTTKGRCAALACRSELHLLLALSGHAGLTNLTSAFGFKTEVRSNHRDDASRLASIRDDRLSE